MIIAMQPGATEKQIDNVIERLFMRGFEVHRSTGEQQTVLGAVGAKIDFDIREIELLEAVQQVHRISAPYKLVGRTFRPEGTLVKFPSGVSIGGTQVIVMAGPCSVESKEQLFSAAEQVSKAGAKFLRGGAFKPRSSPYSFQGMGVEGLKLLREAGDRYGLLIVSEVMEISRSKSCCLMLISFSSARATCRISICCANWERFASPFWSNEGLQQPSKNCSFQPSIFSLAETTT